MLTVRGINEGWMDGVQRQVRGENDVQSVTPVRGTGQVSWDCSWRDVRWPLLFPDPNSGFTVPCPTTTQERTAFLPVAVRLALPP